MGQLHYRQAHKRIERGEGDPPGFHRFILSTPERDRYGTRVGTKSWKLDSFRANPVALWAHEKRRPSIGLVPEIERGKDGRLVVAIQLDLKDRFVREEEIDRKLNDGFLRAVSAGFLVDEWEIVEEEDGEESLVFPEPELLEVSLVTVPGHQGALKMGFEDGDYVRLLKEMAAARKQPRHGRPDADPIREALTRMCEETR